MAVMHIPKNRELKKTDWLFVNNRHMDWW